MPCLLTSLIHTLPFSTNFQINQNIKGQSAQMSNLQSLHHHPFRISLMFRGFGYQMNHFNIPPFLDKLLTLLYKMFHTITIVQRCHFQTTWCKKQGKINRKFKRNYMGAPQEPQNFVPPAFFSPQEPQNTGFSEQSGLAAIVS